MVTNLNSVVVEIRYPADQSSVYILDSVGNEISIDIAKREEELRRGINKDLIGKRAEIASGYDFAIQTLKKHNFTSTRLERLAADFAEALNKPMY